MCAVAVRNAEGSFQACLVMRHRMGIVCMFRVSKVSRAERLLPALDDLAANAADTIEFHRLIVLTRNA